MINDEFKAFSFLYNDADFYIPMNKLETGSLYWILARNAHVGIWFEDAKGFVIPREKFGREYLFVEYHWDTNDEEKFPYGTAKPFELIEVAPFNIDQLFIYDKRYSLGCRLNGDADMANELLDYIFKKSDEFSEEKFLNKFSKLGKDK